MSDGDIDLIAAIQERSRVAAAWRSGLGRVAPSATEAALWAAVDLQSVIAKVSDPERAIGLCAAYGLDSRSGHCSFAAAFEGGPETPSVARVEGVALFLENMFAQLDLRRVLVEATDERLVSFSSILRFGFKRQLTLPGRGWKLAGGPTALHVFSLERGAWMTSSMRAMLEQRGSLDPVSHH